MAKTVYVVHCIDTEGPLYESLEETFERLRQSFGIDLPVSAENLKKVQEGKIPNLDPQLRSSMMRTFSSRLLSYNDNWGKVDRMLDEMLSDGYRMRYRDSQGGGWIFNWFLLDHVGFKLNPRRRDIGYHNIFDHYRRRLFETASSDDGIEWHFHPMSHFFDAHRCGTSFLNSPHLLETLARRVIDRSWFPTCFRAGFHAERPDSHWFLEQWIPFDFSNQAMRESVEDSKQIDIAGGRFGDWRRAPRDWTFYHPSHDDYQVKGSCNRVIFRCLNVGTRLRLMEEEDVVEAFERASRGETSVLAFTNHDFRDMRPDVHYVHSLLERVSAKFPDVAWVHSSAKNAAQEAMGLTRAAHIVRCALERQSDYARLVVDADTEIFGPQPFLAIRLQGGRYINDNFDFQIPKRSWSYTFDENSVPIEYIDEAGVAVTFKDGSCHVINLDLHGGENAVTIYD